VSVLGWSRRSLRRWPVTTPAPRPGERRARRAPAAARAAAVPMSHGRVIARTLVAVMEVIWDLLVFLALVAVGLVVLNLLARRR
jgi:hypothetical protein